MINHSTPTIEQIQKELTADLLQFHATLRTAERNPAIRFGEITRESFGHGFNSFHHKIAFLEGRHVTLLENYDGKVGNSNIFDVSCGDTTTLVVDRLAGKDSIRIYGSSGRFNHPYILKSVNGKLYYASLDGEIENPEIQLKRMDFIMELAVSSESVFNLNDLRPKVKKALPDVDWRSAYNIEHLVDKASRDLKDHEDIAPHPTKKPLTILTYGISPKDFLDRILKQDITALGGQLKRNTNGSISLVSDQDEFIISEATDLNGIEIRRFTPPALSYADWQSAALPTIAKQAT